MSRDSKLHAERERIAGFGKSVADAAVNDSQRDHTTTRRRKLLRSAGQAEREIDAYIRRAHSAAYASINEPGQAARAPAAGRED
ncbi:MAG: hypothetical protein KDJ44_10615 [Rhodoblastus sp.]|nr:hypothetical protein [Rhodoblastus sp.]